MMNDMAGEAPGGGSIKPSLAGPPTAAAVDAAIRPILAVFIVWHPNSASGEQLAVMAFKELCADPDLPSVRGLGIPVRFRTAVGASEVPAPVPFGGAVHTAVFVLADDALVASALWRTYLEGLVESRRPSDVIIPVALTDVRNLPAGLRSLQAIRLDRPAADIRAVFLRDGIHDVCRVLDPNAAQVRVFLSHAKQDGLELTTVIRRYLNEEARLDEFFDAADIPDGARFAEFVTTAAGSQHALLAVQTDSYASREWCRLEVLEAKRQQVPIVVLAAFDRGEPRSFPYIGNVPVVRWHGNESLPLVVAALLREVLRARYFPRRVEAICRLHGLQPARQVFAYPPELLTALIFRRQAPTTGATRDQLVYPDPPLGTKELELLRLFDPDLEPVTPTMLRAS